MAFQDQVRVAFSPTYKKQTSQGTALANGELTASFTANLIRYERVPVYKVFRDCTNLFLRRRQPQSRYYRITLEFDASAHMVGGFLAGAMGIAAAPTGVDPKTHALTMLSPAVRELSYHTLILGHEDGSGEAWKYKDVAYGRVRFEAAAGTDTSWRGTVDMVASGARTSVTGWTWPACIDEAPAVLYDGAFVVNGVDYIDQTKSLFCEYDNAVLVNDAPFVGGSLDAQRWLYGGAARGYLLGGAVIATDRPGDTLAALLYANSDVGTEVADTSVRIGSATNGVTLLMPLADATASDAGQDYYGEATEGVLNVAMLAKKVAGDAESPMSATAVIPNAQQSTAFEVAA
jgi:hypothetical protein